ncbi:hypothetical protein [Streptomyces sp. NPDC018693]|uniref:hypothetical protein n=1 Tax=unclassified Streptomyces TaxID=2593676 RepID=UPI0037AE01DD
MRRTTSTVPARPVLIAALALTATGSLLLTPQSATGAEPGPVAALNALLKRRGTTVRGRRRRLRTRVGRADRPPHSPARTYDVPFTTTPPPARPSCTPSGSPPPARPVSCSRCGS